MVQFNRTSVLVNKLLTKDKYENKDAAAMKLEEPSSPETPTILKELEDCRVTEGEAALFKFCASGNPLPVVSWFHGEEKIEESRQFTMLVEPDKSCCSNMFRHVLVVTRSSPEFAGCYTCEATNSEGTVRSTANLCVKSSHIIERKVSMFAFGRSGKQAVQVKKEKPENYFTINEELGRGKFGVVYKCVDNETNQEYAAKVSKCRAPSQRKIIQNEIDILNQLSHPLIVDMIAAFEFSRQFVVILELVSGGELFERLMEEELISEMDVTFYVKQLLRAINYMHEVGILHLDLKPENIMLVSKNSTQIKLIDFSLACRVEQGDTTKVMAGTREFVSPEVINYDAVSTATDMWSIGVITYVLLASFTPFAGDSDSEISSNIMRCDWSCDDDVFDDISEDAKDFISTLIVKEPENRATGGECLEHAWFQSIQTVKKIKTAHLISFIAKKNWRKTIAAVRTTTFLSRIASLSKCEEECTKNNQVKENNCKHTVDDLVTDDVFDEHEEKSNGVPNGTPKDKSIHIPNGTVEDKTIDILNGPRVTEKNGPDVNEKNGPITEVNRPSLSRQNSLTYKIAVTPVFSPKFNIKIVV